MTNFMYLGATGGTSTGDTVQTVVDTISTLSEGFVDWIGDGVSVITGHPLLLGLFMIGFMSVGIAAIRRFF